LHRKSAALAFFPIFLSFANINQYSWRNKVSLERTLTLIKPDGVEQGHMGDIIRLLEANQFQIRAAKMLHLNKDQAAGFYAVHRGKPFFESLLNYISSGPVLVMVLEREGAIGRLRELMGATNPEKADPGTIRKLYATSMERNAIHGSDGLDTAKMEIAYFFNAFELV
jgi:nucleoside-diphosphate kinase